MDAKDVLSLRLTCDALKKDVDAVFGVCIKLHEGKLDFEKVLQTFGIAKLNVERLMQDNMNKSAWIPKPELLKTLVVSGAISKRNLEFLLKIPSDLKELGLYFNFLDQAIQADECLKSTPLTQLRVLDIACTVGEEVSESPIVMSSIKDFLNCVSCHNLTTFKFHIYGTVISKMHDYHQHALKFVTKYQSLKKVDICIKQLVIVPVVEAVEGGRERENTNEHVWKQHEGSRMRISMIKLDINNYCHLWFPLLDSQTYLRSLSLKLRGQTWNHLIIVLNKNADTLKSLIIDDLCSTSHDGITTIPVDFGILRILKALENLEVKHIDMESRGLEAPEICQTSYLPQTLKELKLSHLRIKPHQAIFMLVKLPLLKTLDLEGWISAERTLVGFLSVVTFLLKFDMTPVRSIVLMDSKRRMENRQLEINKMITSLPNGVNVVHTENELLSGLKILRN